MSCEERPLSGPVFVTPLTMTVADCLPGASFPAGAAYRGQYIRVSDYGGYVDRVMRCDYDSSLGLYFWVPTQGEYARSMALAADTTFRPLSSPTSIVLTGALGGLGTTRNVTFDPTNGRPGMTWEVSNAMTGLGGLNILGTSIGSAVALILGSYQKYVIDGSSGSLKVVRMV